MTSSGFTTAQNYHNKMESESESENLCPICLNHEAQYYTECNHAFCVTCLSRITPFYISNADFYIV